MLFAKKIVQTVATIPEAEPDASRSSLPVDSVISKAPSLAPSQAPRAGYFSKWTGRPAPDYSVAFTAAASPPVDPIVKELTLKNAKLQDDNDQLKEVSYFNRLTLQKLANDFDSKDQECTRLHAAIRALNADICEKDQNIESLDEKLLSTQGTNSVADKLSAQNTAMLVNSLNQERSLTSELQRSITEKDDQLSALIISLNSTQSSHASLYQERTQLSQALAQARTTIPSLQNENNALASRAAASENAHAKLAAFIPALETQVQDLVASVAAQTRKHKAQVDAMQAQYAQARDQSEARIAVKDTAVRGLQTQLELTDPEAGKNVAAHSEEIAQLHGQLARLTLLKEDEEAQKTAWQDYTNEQRSRGDSLADVEAQVDAWQDYANEQRSRGDNGEAQVDAWRDYANEQRSRGDDLQDEVEALENLLNDRS